MFAPYLCYVLCINVIITTSWNANPMPQLTVIILAAITRIFPNTAKVRLATW